jgi:putative methionine-R-sulfoxide reductase with GAF domain
LVRSISPNHHSVIEPRAGTVIGTIDVGSERANAFTDADQETLEECARAALPLWT